MDKTFAIQGKTAKSANVLFYTVATCQKSLEVLFHYGNEN